MLNWEIQRKKAIVSQRVYNLARRHRQGECQYNIRNILKLFIQVKSVFVCMIQMSNESHWIEVSRDLKNMKN